MERRGSTAAGTVGNYRKKRIGPDAPIPPQRTSDLTVAQKASPAPERRGLFSFEGDRRQEKGTRGESGDRVGGGRSSSIPFHLTPPSTLTPTS